jgi:hypothetical protein
MIEQDQHIPPSDIIVRIAHRLETDPDFLCALAGKLSKTTERKLVTVARKDIKFFRQMIDRIGGR